MCPFVYAIQYCIGSEYGPVLNVWIIFFTYLIDMDYPLLKVLTAMNCPLLKLLTDRPLLNYGTMDGP